MDDLGGKPPIFGNIHMWIPKKYSPYFDQIALEGKISHRKSTLKTLTQHLEVKKNTIYYQGCRFGPESNANPGNQYLDP